MATTTQNLHTRVETATSMARFSIGEDDDDAPPVNKRQRFSEPASQSQPLSHRQTSTHPSQSQSRVMDLLGEDDVEDNDDLESDSLGYGEEDDDDDDDFEAVEEEEEEDEIGEDAGSDDDGGEAESVSDQSQRITSMAAAVYSHLGLQSCTAPPPVFNNSIGELPMVLSDPDVLDCPICLDPLCSPVFQCENGHIACSLCCSKVKRKCPSCCMPIGYNRCRAIEKVVESIKVSCKNARYGCKETMPYSKKNDHEQKCPHATCFCPHSSCPFLGSSKNLYLHFGIQHAASTTRFTYNTTFPLLVGSNQKYMFLQEQHESVIFILNHEVKEHGRAFSIDCIGPSSLKTAFIYQLTAKNMETSLSLQSVPQVYTNWSHHTLKKSYLTVPSDFSSFSVPSLQICIKKAPSST